MRLFKIVGMILWTVTWKEWEICETVSPILSETRRHVCQLARHEVYDEELEARASMASKMTEYPNIQEVRLYKMEEVQ